MDRQEHRIERRLAGVFAADVAGYSRLMSQDEAGTLQKLAAHREIMDRLVRENGGRIANTARDSVLAEFPSAVDAVPCAGSLPACFQLTGSPTPVGWHLPVVAQVFFAPAVPPVPFVPVDYGSPA